jgi:hypothetical protein
MHVVASWSRTPSTVPGSQYSWANTIVSATIVSVLGDPSDMNAVISVSRTLSAGEHEHVWESPNPETTRSVI